MATDYEAIKEEVKQYYADLLILQYQRPKAIAEIKLLASLLVADAIFLQIRDKTYNVDESIGEPLDFIGKWVCVDRYFKGQRFDNKKFFAYYDWNATDEPNILQGGYQDWNNIREDDAPFLTYEDLLSTKNKLNDDDFRILIKLKIIKNNVPLFAKNIDDAIYKLFGDLVYTTWGECMELTYHYNYSLRAIINLAKEKNVLPVPTGVKLKLQEIING